MPTGGGAFTEVSKPVGRFTGWLVGGGGEIWALIDGLPLNHVGLVLHCDWIKPR